MDGSNCNTVPKQLKPFVKGDPRINRKGRPKTFDAARALAQQIGHEVAKVAGADGADVAVVHDGHYVTVIEAILRQWATSKNPDLQRAFMAYAVGEPPKTIQHEGVDAKPIEIVTRLVRKGGGDGEVGA